MLLLAQGQEAMRLALDRGALGVLAMCVVVRLHRGKDDADKAHRAEMAKVKDECKAELLRLSTEYRDKVETLYREQLQVMNTNNAALRDAASAIRDKRKSSGPRASP